MKRIPVKSLFWVLIFAFLFTRVYLLLLASIYYPFHLIICLIFVLLSWKGMTMGNKN